MPGAKPKPRKELHGGHGQSDNVPGNSYAVKASGFAPARHAQDFGIFLGLTPKTKQYQVSLTKRKVLRAGTPIVEDVLIQKRVQLRQGDIQVSSGLGFCVELLHWLKRSCHKCFSLRIPLPGMRGSNAVVPLMAGLRNQVNCPIAVSLTPYDKVVSLPG